MRLSKIKLSGFKSFVDPTIIPFTSNLSAVVGPNGCGKSNVMDAIRWVLGESSAKHLRGGQLTDVIFSGSTSRKPLGRASVELHFDNSDGTLLGEYAGYAEVVIRREVSRSDGLSVYYINGLRCRRRDVMDLFMGTGLGPRSYAIIEQGMISRVIEAKPEDLRVFIEEAAGISKYKERRKETENRIRHTRDNLERLTDIRDELEKQVAHLKKQALVAQKFKSLREEEHIVNAQLAAISWQRLQTEVLNQEALIQSLATELESHLADYQHVETTLEKQRLAQQDLNVTLREVQGRYYAVGSEISTLEQKLQHHQERGQQLSRDKEDAKRNLDQAHEHIRTDEMQIEALNESIVELEPVYNEARLEAELVGEQQLEKEDKLEDLREKWDVLLKELEKIHRHAEVEKTKIVQLEGQMQQSMARLTRLSEEQARLQNDNTTDNVEKLEQDIEGLDTITQTFNEKLEDNKEQRQDLHNHQAQLKPSINSLQKRIQQLEGRKSSLEALQQAALGQDGQPLSKWLQAQALHDQKRLAQLIRVQEPWSQAVEMVLAELLEALYLTQEGQMESALQGVERLENSSLVLLQGLAPMVPALENTLVMGSAYPRLLDHIVLQTPQGQSDPILERFLANIYTADTVEAALVLQAQLIEQNVMGSVITPQGAWLGPGWARIKTGSKEGDGILRREEELREVDKALQAHILESEANQSHLREVEDALLECEALRDGLQIDRNQAHRRLSEAAAQLQTYKASLAHKNARLVQIETEQNEIQSVNQQAQTDIMVARQIIAQTIEHLAEKTERKAELELTRNAIIQGIQNDKTAYQEKKEYAHDLALELQKYRTQLSAITGNMSRAMQQLEILTEKIENITHSMEENVAPLIDLQDRLSHLLDERLKIQTELNQAQDAVSGLENEIHQLEKRRTNFEGASQSTRDRLEQTKMDWQALQIHRENAQSKLTNTEFQLEQLLEQMPPDANETLWQSRLTKLANQIQNLGAINLAAIEECAAQEQRQLYLESQYSDLMEALNILEQSIEKIDKETRTRFKETFNTVNENFKVLFPKLFGGGEANLGLIGDDLLESGISVIGRPPGKRNSSIHQLSGGEKALTAVSLVFAIFQLNPAPFCLLDEVDAPLDDNNVGRFCALVKEMSESVQFIYISHNKLALELAGELQGVTMREPGVSRIVTVDIEKATQMMEEA